MPLSPGDHAPSLAATNQHGDRLTLSFGQPTVLYFYPRDDTPGCTTEATEFDDVLGAYREAGVAVYGVSTDDAESHRAFAQAHDIGFDLLADPDGNIAAAYGVPVENGAARRTTFVLVDGVVRAVYDGVHPEGHAEAVLADLVETGLVTVGE
jgi:peroxiredoxin Q/BCP